MEDRPVLEIEVTPAMIAAGIEALCLYSPVDDDLAMVVRDVYDAMHQLEPAALR